MLSVPLLLTSRIRQGTLVIDAAKEAALFTGFNKKTGMTYLKQFFNCKGKFEDSKWGKVRMLLVLIE